MSQQEPSLQTLEGERGIPGVNTPRFSSKKRVWVALGIVIAGVALGGMAYKKLTHQETTKTAQQTESRQEMSHTHKPRTFNTPETPLAPPEALGAPPPAGQGASAPAGMPPPLPAGMGDGTQKSPRTDWRVLSQRFMLMR